MSHFKSLPIFFLLLLFISSISSALEFSPDEIEFLQKHKTIRVHNESNWPPFNFNENGTPQGISIDVMNKIAGITGLNIKYVTGPSWNEFMEMMDSNDLDVMLNIVDLPERQKELRFTSPYAKSLSGIFVSTSNSQKYFSFSDLKGKTIAIPAGFDLEITLPKYHPELNILLVEDTLEAIDAVHSGKADAFMEELGVVDYVISQRMLSDLRLAFQINEPTFISELTIATSHQNPLLFSIIQKGLNALSADELNKIRKKWLLKVYEIYEQSMINLTIAEKEFLYKNNRVNICVDPSWPPLDFINDKGIHSGLSADLINKIAPRVGVKLNLIPTETWAQTLNFLKQGRCDIIPLMNEIEDARSYIDFTQAYFQFATVIATRNDASFIGDYSELYGKKVALQAYYFITEYVKQNHPQIEIIEVENTREALKLVNEQKAFATIDGLPNIVNTIEALALENIKIAGSVPQENKMKMGVHKGNELLLSIFNKGISSLSEKEKIGLYKKWFDIEIANQFFNHSFILKIIGFFCLVLFFLLWRHFTLNKYASKLKQLNEKLWYSSTMDHLTKIYNRRTIERHLNTEIKKTKQTQQPLSIVSFDIDHFKLVNDTFGHLSGDAVLQKIASLVKCSIRKSDHIGRWGGEEFLLILPDTQHNNAEKVADNLRKKIEQFDFELERFITASFGVTEYKTGEDTTILLSRVDACLYEAKREGRNRVVNAY